MNSGFLNCGTVSDAKTTLLLTYFKIKLKISIVYIYIYVSILSSTENKRKYLSIYHKNTHERTIKLNYSI